MSKIVIPAKTVVSCDRCSRICCPDGPAKRRHETTLTIKAMETQERDLCDTCEASLLRWLTGKGSRSKKAADTPGTPHNTPGRRRTAATTTQEDTK